MYPKSAAGPAALLLLLCGCGRPAVVPTPRPVLPRTPIVPSVLSALPGDWLALGMPTPSGTFTFPVAGFSGAIAVSGTTIAGIFRAFAPDAAAVCPSVTTAIHFTGTLDAANNLTLTAPLSGGTATITAGLSQNLQTYTPGSYQVVGGTCAMPATAMHLAQFASATGTYTGTFNAMDLSTNTIIPGTATALTATFVQSSTPAADGQFPLTGTVISTGACAGKLVITAGTVSGGAILGHPPLVAAPPSGDFNGALNPTATTLIGGYSLFSGCPSLSYFGTLTRQ